MLQLRDYKTEFLADGPDCLFREQCLLISIPEFFPEVCYLLVEGYTFSFSLALGLQFYAPGRCRGRYLRLLWIGNTQCVQQNYLHDIVWPLLTRPAWTLCLSSNPFSGFVKPQEDKPGVHLPSVTESPNHHNLPAHVLTSASQVPVLLLPRASFHSKSQFDAASLMTSSSFRCALLRNTR